MFSGKTLFFWQKRNPLFLADKVGLSETLTFSTDKVETGKTGKLGKLGLSQKKWVFLR